MKNQSDIYFLKLLQDSINALNELDNLIDSNSSRQNEVDAELLDLLHLIENNELCDSACIKITRRIQELRKTRRRIKNEHELIVKYNEIKTKLSSKDNRQFITAEINKRMNDKKGGRSMRKDPITPCCTAEGGHLYSTVVLLE